MYFVVFFIKIWHLNTLSAKEIRRGSVFPVGGWDHCEHGCMVLIPLTFQQTKSPAYELYKS